VGESPSARTQRELAELRGSIDRDVDALLARAKADLDPAALVRRQPLAVLGTLGSVAALGAAAIARRVRDARRKRPDTEIERVIERLGGNLERLKGRARKRFREQLRTEISEVEKPKRSAQEAAWGVGLAALTAGATELARRLAGRVAADDPADDPSDLPPAARGRSPR
jgi:hypothetical protein